MERKPIDTKHAYGRIYDRRIAGLYDTLKANEYKVLADPDNRHLVAKMNKYKNKAWVLYFLTFVEFLACMGLVYFYSIK
jgi:hypothetical protein